MESVSMFHLRDPVCHHWVKQKPQHSGTIIWLHLAYSLLIASIKNASLGCLKVGFRLTPRIADFSLASSRLGHGGVGIWISRADPSISRSLDLLTPEWVTDRADIRPGHSAKRPSPPLYETLSGFSLICFIAPNSGKDQIVTRLPDKQAKYQLLPQCRTQIPDGLQQRKDRAFSPMPHGEIFPIHPIAIPSS